MLRIERSFCLISLLLAPKPNFFSCSRFSSSVSCHIDEKFTDVLVKTANVELQVTECNAAV